MKTRRFLAEKFFLKILYLPLWKVLRRENKNNHVPSTFLVWVADLYKTAGSIRSTDVSGCEQPKYFLVPRSCFLYLQYTYIHNTIHRKMLLRVLFHYARRISGSYQLSFSWICKGCKKYTMKIRAWRQIFIASTY